MIPAARLRDAQIAGSSLSGEPPFICACGADLVAAKIKFRCQRQANPSQAIRPKSSPRRLAVSTSPGTAYFGLEGCGTQFFRRSPLSFS
jgi:hypothetical protein